ncbi:RNA polymerase sigma factor [Aliikangiella marina]|uniref:RNA polymerase sigma factor n=1 Tax=Aliikangiella marina TaxID=1712262 RepID=UPI00163D826B|nr:sigma-70 family RNA polymerase sigma factor [Aliikangiella marina]
MSLSVSQEQEAISLIERIAEGQQGALERFYRLFESSVYRFALSKLNDPFDAADILNEVMMEVWKSAKNFQGRSKVSTWILGITNFKSIDRVRQKARKQTAELSDTIEDESPEFESLISAAQSEKQVNHCMSKLKDEFKEVIHLAFFEDLHYEDIAEIVECPAGTIKSRVFHAKNALKQCLQKFLR